MGNTKNKTQPTKQSVSSLINAIEDTSLRKDAKVLLKLFTETTGIKPVLWGSMIGFGSYHYKYPSGREGDYFATGFAIRKSGPVIYVLPGYEDYKTLLEKIGPHKKGKSCLYLKSLENVDLQVLEKLIKLGIKDLGKVYPVTMK
jgi:hypothetical protein